MFSKTAFRTWSKSGAGELPVFFVSVETKIPGRAHDRLLRDLKMPFFPSLAILDAKGSVLLGGLDGDLEALRFATEAAALHQRLAPLAAAGKDVDAVDWFRARLGLGKITGEKAHAELKSLDVEGALRKKLRRHVFAFEISSFFAAIQNRSAKLKREDMQARVYEIYKAGYEPPVESKFERFFDSSLLHASARRSDRAVYETRYARVVKRTKDQLAMLKRSVKQSKRPASKFMQRIIEHSEAELVRLRAQADELGVKR